jgi:GT2 family glycosyltransferase
VTGLRLSIVTAVCGANEVTREWLTATVGQSSGECELVIVANGSTPAEIDELRGWLDTMSGIHWLLVTKPDPLGSTRAFNLGIGKATGDVVAMLHNDLMIREPGWDRRLVREFATADVGVCGFHGSRRLGDEQVWSRPYDYRLLGRGDNYSNLTDAESHGVRCSRVLEVVTLDGMGLVARRADLLHWGGLDERYIHHMYDHDLCLTARRHGRRNFMVPIVATHLSGRTANSERYNSHFAALGNDTGIHLAAHEAFYLKWRGTGALPARC